MKARNRRRRVGCLLPLLFYVLLLVPGYYLALPAPVTEDFTGRNAHLFYIAATTGEGKYSTYSLEDLRSEDASERALTFLLNADQITIEQGDIHHASVLEQHDDWQLVKFNYSNSHTSSSVYRAYTDRVEPVRYQMTSNVGHAMLMLALVIPAYLFAALYNFVRNWRENRRAKP